MSGQAEEIARYIINGVVATGIHYGVLTFNINVLNFSSAGLANLFAASVGITASFLGSRYFVYRKLNESILSQVVKFGGLYGALALLHGFVLLIWTDWMGLNFSIGFIIATMFQVALSYMGNKLLVFRT